MDVYKLYSLWRYESISRILKANLSWTRKKPNSSDAEYFSSVIIISFFFAPKARFQVLKFEFCQIMLG